ncbi:MAG: hypothetical protein M3443_04155 [Actinomycetota bacterium]|nr:hypothetical protein [Actinomycetota bacterium]
MIRKGSGRYRDARIERADQRPEVYELVLSTGSATGRQVDASLTSTGRPQRPNGASAATRRGVMLTPETSFNQKMNLRASAPERALSLLSAPCGQCDARPGDPVSARVVWLDVERVQSERCGRRI